MYGVSVVVDVVYPGAAPSEAEQAQMTPMCWQKKKKKGKKKERILYNILKINLKYIDGEII